RGDRGGGAPRSRARPHRAAPHAPGPARRDARRAPAGAAMATARPRGLIALALLGLLAWAAGCARTPDGERKLRLPGQLAPVESDRETGFAFDREIQKQLPLVEDLEVLAFVDELGQRLVDHLGDQPFDYRFRVLPHPELNAFAVPGGYIYLHSATILEAGSIEELAGVIAHEL